MYFRTVAAELQSPVSNKSLEPNSNGTGRENIQLHESESVMTISKIADADVDNNNTPLKGETPPTGRRAQAGQLLRRMTKMSKVKGLKDEGKDWLKGRIKARKGKGDGDTSSSDSDTENKHAYDNKDDVDASEETATATPKPSKYVKYV